MSLVCPLFFDLTGIGVPTRSLRPRQHSSPGHWGIQTSFTRQFGSPQGYIYIVKQWKILVFPDLLFL
jgi:hypothetical protein